MDADIRRLGLDAAHPANAVRPAARRRPGSGRDFADELEVPHASGTDRGRNPDGESHGPRTGGPPADQEVGSRLDVIA